LCTPAIKSTTPLATAAISSTGGQRQRLLSIRGRVQRPDVDDRLATRLGNALIDQGHQADHDQQHTDDGDRSHQNSVVQDDTQQ
jgi:hypothetical protein